MVFTVEKTGVLSGVEITGTHNEEYKNAALTLSKVLLKWTLAKWHNRTIKSTYSVPLRYMLK